MTLQASEVRLARRLNLLICPLNNLFYVSFPSQQCWRADISKHLIARWAIFSAASGTSRLNRLVLIWTPRTLTSLTGASKWTSLRTWLQSWLRNGLWKLAVEQSFRGVRHGVWRMTSIDHFLSGSLRKHMVLFKIWYVCFIRDMMLLKDQTFLFKMINLD